MQFITQMMFYIGTDISNGIVKTRNRSTSTSTEKQSPTEIGVPVRQFFSFLPKIWNVSLRVQYNYTGPKATGVRILLLFL